MRRVIISCLLVACASPVWADGPLRRVISGDRFIFKGREIQLRDTECPAADTEEAQEAKRILGIMLFARKLECTYEKTPRGYVGDCLYAPSPSSKAGRSMAAELKRRNLCQPFGRT